MTRDRLLLIIGLGTFFTAALYFMTGKSPYPAVGIGGLAALLVFALWRLPRRPREAPDSERLKTTSRAVAGGNAAEPTATERTPLRAGKGKRKKRKKRR